MLHLNDQLVPGHLQRSSARLRTRSGCGECKAPPCRCRGAMHVNNVNNTPGRQRRKKCDEKRPRCGGCTRNGFECRWPGETQLVDRRRRPRTSDNDPTAVPGFFGLSLPPPVSMPAPFRSSEHLRIYRYFAHSIAPKLVRQTALSRYSHELHIVRLALVHPPLMGALIAIAGMRMSSQSPGLQLLALQSYLFSISSLKTGIMEGRYAGTEDWLLATTTCLCVFEVRTTTPPRLFTHRVQAKKYYLHQELPLRWDAQCRVSSVSLWSHIVPSQTKTPKRLAGSRRLRTHLRGIISVPRCASCAV